MPLNRAQAEVNQFRQRFLRYLRFNAQSSDLFG